MGNSKMVKAIDLFQKHVTATTEASEDSGMEVMRFQFEDPEGAKRVASEMTGVNMDEFEEYLRCKTFEREMISQLDKNAAFMAKL